MPDVMQSASATEKRESDALCLAPVVLLSRQAVPAGMTAGNGCVGASVLACCMTQDRHIWSNGGSLGTYLLIGLCACGTLLG